MDLQVHLIADAPDPRGSRWSVPQELLPLDFVIRDAHVMTLLPGAVRGDHFPCGKREVVPVTYLEQWTLYRDGGSRQCDGWGCAAIAVPPRLSHAISNSGHEPLHVVALSDAPYNPAQPDAVPGKVSVP